MSSLKKDPKAYWRSLAELADEPAFRAQLAREFPDSDVGESGSFSRRRFMQLMGASLALGSGASCRWERDYLMPFARRPTGHVPGEAQHYATCMELGGHAQPLQVASYDGRPIKVEGAAGHPAARGGSSSFAQASVLEMYDPDRSQGIRRHRPAAASATWSEVAQAFAASRTQAEGASGAGLHVLCEATSSPSVWRLRAQLLARLPQAHWHEYEALSRDNERAGLRQACGAELRALHDYAAADVVLSCDDDFLTDHPHAVRYGLDSAKKRHPDRPMSRLYVLESRYSSTGASADHRLPLRAEQVGPFLLAVAAELSGGAGVPADLAPLKDAPRDGFLAAPATAKLVRAVARDLARHPGHGIITVGPGQPPAVHALAHHLNSLLGNVGTTVTYLPEPGGERPSHAAALEALCSEMQAGRVQTLLILGGNPCFTAAPRLKFAEALAKVESSVHLSLFVDETSRACAWHLPRAHYLESWGDARSYDGTYTLQQPLIKPLYGGRTVAEVLALWLGEGALKGLEIAKQTFAASFGGALDVDAQWHKAVHDGHVAGSAPAAVTPARQPLTGPPPVDPKAYAPGLDNGDLEVTTWGDSHVYDGRFANNGWLQELPDFMSKLTWDNVALVAPQTAKKLNILHESLVEVTVGGAAVTVAAYVMPGQPQGSLAVSLGYGRREAGHVGGTVSGDVAAPGFDTYGLLDARGGAHAANASRGATVRPLGRRYELGVTQDHHSMDTLAHEETQSRIGEIVREASLAEYEENHAFAAERVEHPPLVSLWQGFDYSEGNRWGMAIDLNSCTGCNACVVACQAENNIPIVGKEQVIRGREMHWLRIDRYFSGDADAPEVASQPMLCQQCENAPCESVCPVAATVHSHEGLNDMVYNRCVGTRYCSNNCPYKVRRFNFFNYHKNLVDPRNQVAKMVYNPEVTVRARGVMEKCNYCVQRIQNVKIPAHNAKRRIKDGEWTTACSQACSAGAIVVGDLNDKDSQVAKLHEDPRCYGVLEQLHTQPRTKYLAKVRNPNPELS